jgi:hypothetical protein
MEPSTWHTTLVYFGFRYDGPLPSEQDRKVIRFRRISALGLVLMLVILVVAALQS